MLDRIKILQRAPRLLARLRRDNPEAASGFPDFGAPAMAAHREIAAAVAGERSWRDALQDIDQAARSLEWLGERRDLHGAAACLRLARDLRRQHAALHALDAELNGTTRPPHG